MTNPNVRRLPIASLLFCALAGQPALAQTPDREMARCASIADAGARLSCLDALAAAAVARLLPAAQATPLATLQAAQAKAQEQAFGAPPPKPAPAAAAVPNAIDSEIEGFVAGWRPNQQFRLKNGQLWRVSDGSSGELGLHNPKVRIKRNLFGTYFLEFAGRNDAPKVRRIE